MTWASAFSQSINRYIPVSSSDRSPIYSSSVEDANENDQFIASIAEKTDRVAHIHRYRGATLAVLSMIINMILLAYILLRAPSLEMTSKYCGRALGQWLPGWEDGVEYEVQRFKGSFGLKSPFTGIGPDVDEAWDNITDGPTGGAIGITKEQWQAVNPHHDYPVLLEEDHGTGRYLASLDVFHQLHCVDLLRKNTHREYYDKHEGSFAGAPAAVIDGHLEHCIETLRQVLMCHGDISLLTYNWVEGRDMPYPNFNTIHTCKKWDTLTKWNMGRDVTAEWKDGGRTKGYKPPTKPADVVGMKVPP